MSELTLAPANDPFTPETMAEAQTLISLLRRLGVTTALSDVDGDPTFIFSKGDDLDEGGLVALMVENRWKAEEDFREALKSALTKPTEAEQACGSLESMGFLTAVVWSDGAPPTPSLVFEPSGLDAMKPAALDEIELVRRRFVESKPFADEMVDYLVGIGAAYEAIAKSQTTPPPAGVPVMVRDRAKAEPHLKALKQFAPDPALDAVIEAKVDAALQENPDLLKAEADSSQRAALMARLDFTEEERAYMGSQGLLLLVRIEVGRKVVETLNAGNMRIGREDLLTSLTAYFDAVVAGEIEEAA